MDGGEEHISVSDEAFERELRAVLNVEASPEFLAKLRARVEDERDRQHSMVSGWWLWAGAIAATAAIVIAGTWLSRPAAPSVHVPQLTTTSPEPSAAPTAVPPLTTAPLHPALVARTARRVVPSRDAAPVASEVLISQEEAAALRQLFAAINQGRLEPSQLPDLETSLAPPAPIEVIEIEPITLAALDAEQGVRP